ncbi:MAG: hypothetical protein JSW66_03215 [Phycisphaerales bacterium]|nr:MAG: hypothetical protein JSW66_03215 [Phycisphaerales bacterium]
MKRSLVLCIAALSVLLAAGAKGNEPSNADRIKPYAENPRYWQYKGRPVLLLGGSKTDHIFLLDDLERHLDEIVSVGANYVRNTMSQREGLDLKPHKRRPDGKFDLNQWNTDYWDRFANCLRWCRQRDIIIQIEVWDRFDFSREHWQNSPWRPANNINYTSEQSGLANNYPAPAYRDRQPFFHTIAGMPLYKKQLEIVRAFQEEFVSKMLSYSLRYSNVLYCMNNETSTPAEWGRYWMRFIKARAAAEGAEVYVTDMFDDAWKPKVSAKLKQAFDDPQAYGFLDVSQVNSRTFNQDHWENMIWISQQARDHPRPLNHTKIYSDGQTGFGSGTPTDGVERFWRNLIAGSASCRFHRPTSGIGLNETAKACIKAARKIESLIEFWDIEPHIELLSERQPDEAYLAAKAGEQYVLFLTDGGSIGVDLKACPGTFTLQWVNIQTGDWGPKADIEGSKIVTIVAPGEGPWAAAIAKE